jgi:DNA-binding MarR family transcriptional regulator
MNIEDIVKLDKVSLQMKAMINLRITSNYISHVQNKQMNAFDLTMPQFNILRILRGAGKPLTVNTIKERMIEKSPNTTRLMDKLLEKNFIERYGCKEDRRQSNVQITSSGMSILKNIDESEFSLSLKSDSLSDKEAETLSDLLDKVRESF